MSVHGYNIILNEQHCNEYELLKEHVSSMQELLTKTYTLIVDNYDDNLYKIVGTGSKLGDFRDDVTAITGRLYHDWTFKGAKNRFWRMMTSHAYQQYSSRIKRKQIIDVITAGGYEKVCTELRDDLTSQGLYPKNTELENIFRDISRNDQQNYSITPVHCDYTVGDKSIVRQEVVEGTVYVSLQCGSDHWFNLSYQLPTHLNLHLIEKVSKPVLHIDEDNNLCLRFTVFMEDREVVNLNEDLILGYDAGKIKPVTCAAVHRDGEYSRELTSSRELDVLNDKLNRLYVNKRSVSAKLECYEDLLVNNEDGLLIDKYLNLYEEHLFISRKITNIKEHKSWLIARDMIVHALEHNCATIHAEELSWVGSTGGKWDRAVTLERAKHKSQQYGVKVEIVDARGTSWEYPIEYAVNPAPQAKYDPATRTLSIEGHEPINKDYSASIACAVRTPLKKGKKRKKKESSRKRAIQPKRCRDKNYPTPQRPKKKILKDIDDEVVKNFIESKRENHSSYSASVCTSITVVEDTVVSPQVMSNGSVSIHDT